MNAAQHDAWETIAARARDRQRRVRRRGQPRRPRGRACTFWGQSFVADPFGRVLAQRVARPRRRSCVVDVRPRAHRARRGSNWPFLRDRRIDAYGGLSRSGASTSRDAAPTPAALGYRMPAEWEPHAATWLAWPHRSARPGRASVAAVPRRSSCEMVERAGRARARATSLVDDAATRRAGAALPGAGGRRRERRSCTTSPTDDAWIRDHGPIFLRRPATAASCARRPLGLQRLGRQVPAADARRRGAARAARARCGVAGVRARASCWRAARSTSTARARADDRAVPAATRTATRARRAPSSSGRCATTSASSEVLWLGEGIAGDDTDGHVDDIARFVSPRHDRDGRRGRSGRREPRAAAGQLAPARSMPRRQPAGRSQVVELPMPGRDRAEGERLPASYANFYIANGVVLVPVYGTRTMPQALEILRGSSRRRSCRIPCETSSGASARSTASRSSSPVSR